MILYFVNAIFSKEHFMYNSKKAACFQSTVLAAAMLLCTSCASNSSSPHGDSVKPTADQYLTVDFSQRSGAPLVKKFGMFDSGLVSLSRTERHISTIEDLCAESLRIELGMGRSDMIFDDLITGNSDSATYNWDNIDHFAEILNSRGVHPYFAYGYCPYPLQGDKRDSRSQPDDLTAWSSMLSTITAHFRENGISIGYHEVWNEPDCGDVFYTGSWKDYCELYAYGARGIRKGNPDAVVGGPSTAWVVDPGNRYREFLSYVKANDLPLDFFSMHHYGTPNQLQSKLQKLRSDIASQGDRFATTAIHINELNTIASPSWNQGGPCDNYKMAANVFEMIDYLVQQNDVEVVSWAQLLESGVDALGIVNTQGHKKAAYNAFAVYARMPVDRYPLTASSNRISGMASADAHRASVVMWSSASTEQSVKLELSSFPFDWGSLTVYRIDGQNGGYKTKLGEDLTPSESIAYSGSGSEPLSWYGTIPANGVVYIEVNDANNNASVLDSDSVSPGNAVIVRQEHFYGSRGKTNYAYFDEHDWIARLGSGEEGSSNSVVGVISESLPDTLNISFDIEGTPSIYSSNSVLGVRMEFETASGYTSTVLFHGGIYDKNRDSALPFGSGKLADQTVEADLSSLNVTLSDYAPDDWNGRLLMIFEMQDCGEQVSADIRVR